MNWRRPAATIAEPTTTGEDDPTDGTGLAHAASGARSPLPVTWAARTHRPDGQTSPEELAASGHSSCFAIAVALCLDNQHTSPRLLVITTTVALDRVEATPTIVSCALRIRVQPPGARPSRPTEPEAILAEVAALCPVSGLVAGAEILGRRRTRHLVSGCTRQTHGRRCSCPTL